MLVCSPGFGAEELPQAPRGADIRIIRTAGTVIETDGSYVVGSNIKGDGNGPIITIASPNVTLDLQGFTLREPSGVFPVIEIIPPVVALKISNGTLNGGFRSISLDSDGTISRTVIIEDMRSNDAAAAGFTAVLLEDVRNVEFRRNDIVDAGRHGLMIYETLSSLRTTGHVDDNSIQNTGGHGIFVQAAALSVRNNRVEGADGSGDAGIVVTASVSCLVSENQVSNITYHGILISDSHGCKVFNNTVTRAGIGGVGIWIYRSDDNLILDNVVRESLAGMFIEGQRNHIERNVLNSNGCGLWFRGDDNTYGRNTVRGNAPGLGQFCTPGTCGGLFPPDSCDDGAGNTSFGDNLIPDRF